MPKARKLFSYPFQRLHVDLCGNDALTIGRLREDRTPGIHDQRMSVGLSILTMMAPLIGSDDP